MARRKRKYILDAPHLTRRRGKSKFWYGHVPGRGEIALGTRDAEEAQRRLLEHASNGGGAQGNGASHAPALLTHMAASFAEIARPPRFTPSTASAYVDRITAFIEWAEGQDLTTSEDISFTAMSKFIKDRTKDGVGPATINRSITAVSVMFAHAKREGLISTNPFRSEDFRELRLREPRPKPNVTTLSPSQINLVLEHADRTCTPAIAALLRMTAGSGIRFGEAHHVDASDVQVIDEKRATLTITPKPGWTTKGYRYREIPISRATAEAAKRFARLRAKAVTDPKTVWKELRRISNETAVPTFSMHDLRRAWASAVHGNGGSLKQVSVWLGHRDVQTTERYIRVFASETTGHEYLPR